MLGLQRQFKVSFSLFYTIQIVDDDYSKDLSLPEFKKAIKDYRLKFSDNDGARLFKIFDRDGSGSIDYDEFLRQIRVSHLNMEYN